MKTASSVLKTLGYPKITDLEESPDGVWREPLFEIKLDCNSSDLIDALEYLIKSQFRRKHNFERGGTINFTENPVNSDWVLKFKPDDSKDFINPISPETT